MATLLPKSQRVNMKGLALQANQLIDENNNAVDMSALQRAADPASRIVNATAATLAVTLASHDGKTVTLNRAGGIAVTLPAASGSGARFRFLVSTTFTTAGTIKVANSSDVMQGVAVQGDSTDGVAHIWAAGATADTITLDGVNTGGFKGDIIEVEDIATNLFQVRIVGDSGGTEATPFSATV